MPNTEFVAVCQDCGKQGGATYTIDGTLPRGTPQVPGTCQSHISGKPNMPHRAKWEKR